MLGYLRDQNVAFVVGPQDYGNFADSFVARMAEYQQHFFHSILQPAGNAQGCAMHVGTNYAFRVRALQQVGGFQDSITEDMATGLAIHQATNPVTGWRWRSVYTPDVLAIGEGPATWTNYFTQQMRWCRGTLETWFGQFLPGARKLPPKVFVHYALLMSYYPATAMAWLLGSVNSMLYLVFGVSSIHMSHNVWLMLYVWLLATQLGIFFLGRRHTVSPFEPEGSLGVLGLVASVLCTPVYVGAFLDTVRRRPSKFMVTPKGNSVNADRFTTFNRHLLWAVFFAAMLAVSVPLGHDNTAMRMWALLPMIVCLTPPLLWVGHGVTTLMTARRRHVVPRIAHAHAHAHASNNMPFQPTEGKGANSR
jgi:cellulose synthase/poly-beta-1,6-N-acetylglucosamine synthase-like glycosyltransferase